MSRRSFLKMGGATAVGVGLLGVYGCGGGGSSAAVEWTTWGNPGEVERFVEFTKKFNRETEDFRVEFVPIPNVEEYDSRLLTEFLGGTGPDLFYSFDSNVGTWVERGIIREITDMLTGPNSQSPPGEVPDGLWGGSRPEEGTYYGIPVDCNPYVFWYNKRVLRDAGVNDDPPDLFERGEWNWDTFRNMLERVRQAGNDGFVFGGPGVETFSWATSNGGRILDGDRFVLHEDERSVEAHTFLQENIRSGNITYAATLPGNQGPEALFMSNRVAFLPAGRWFLPIFSANENLEFDIVPWPANTGNKVEPVAVAGAYMVMSADARDPEAAFRFLTNFVSREGQIFRLQGGGNAVPSVPGADEVVLEGDLPEHAQYFLDAREIGYTYPALLSSVPGLNQGMIDLLEGVFVSGGDIEEALTTAGEEVNRKIREQAREG
jgi:multiple sugar transport system substrate-binding protein